MVHATAEIIIVDDGGHEVVQDYGHDRTARRVQFSAVSG